MYKVKLNNGKVISYNREGNLVGDTILFVHSCLSDKESWNTQIEGLKEEYDCISVDLYGYGDSINPNEEISLKSLAHDLIDFLDEIGIVFFHYIGIGIGGVLAPYMNEACSQIESFTIIDAYCGVENSNQKDEYLKILNKIKTDQTLTDETINLIASKIQIENSKIQKCLKNISINDINIASSFVNLLITRESKLNLLKDIKVKTSFLVGEHNTCTPKEKANEMSSLISNSHVYVVKNTGHLSNVANADEVTKILKRIFDVDESSTQKEHFFF